MNEIVKAYYIDLLKFDGYFKLIDGKPAVWWPKYNIPTFIEEIVATYNDYRKVTAQSYLQYGIFK